MYSIGEISKKVGLKVPTIRYYEDAGMIPAPRRSPGKQRRYSQADLDRLVFIRHARQLGFSLAATRNLIALSEDPGNDCDAVDQVVTRQLESVRHKIALLQALESELTRIASGCRSGSVGDCYVIESLANHELCQTDHDVTAI